MSDLGKDLETPHGDVTGIYEGEISEISSYLVAMSLMSRFREDKQLASAVVQAVSMAVHIVEEDRDAPPNAMRRYPFSRFRIKGWSEDCNRYDYLLRDVHYSAMLKYVDAGDPIEEPLDTSTAWSGSEEWRQPQSTATPNRPQLGSAGTGVEPAVLRRGVLMSLMAILLSTALLLESVAWGLFGMYIGVAAFCLSNFAAYHVREPNVILRPQAALLGCLASIGLALSALVGAL